MVAMRASTGQVLARGQRPGQLRHTTRRSQGAYPPGSTFKVLTSAALIRAGLSPQLAATCTPTVTVDGEVFHNAEGEQPVQNLAQAFTESCNTAFIGLATAHLHPADFTAAATLFGLRSRTAAGAARVRRQRSPARPGRPHSRRRAIGQAGVAFSPLGHGECGGRDRQRLGPREPRARRRRTRRTRCARSRCRPPCTAALRPMMADVVSSGTAAGTGLPSGTHAKTGTAQYYAGGKLHIDAWLMGYDGDIAFAIVVQDSGNDQRRPARRPAGRQVLQRAGEPDA